MEIIHGNEQNFNEVVNDEFVLVDFFATWCGPCKMLGPVLQEMVNERNDVKIVKIDVDECPNLSKQFGIMSVPTLMLFKQGSVIATKYGFMPKTLLENWLEENK